MEIHLRTSIMPAGIIEVRKSLVSDIPAGDEKTAYTFLQCRFSVSLLFDTDSEHRGKMREEWL
jgi:hypothetical protein